MNITNTTNLKLVLRHTLRTTDDRTVKQAPQLTLQEHTGRWQPKGIRKKICRQQVSGTAKE